VDERATVALVGFFLVTVVTLFLLYLVAPAPARVASGGRLVAAGVILVLAAAWYGLLTGVPQRSGVPVPWGSPGLADRLFRLAVVLILGGVVTGLLARTAAPALPEQTRDVPPSL
jgi:hypothetical protein